MLRKCIWIMTILWMAIIFYYSHQPAEISRESSGRVLMRLELLQEDEISVIGDARILQLQFMIRKAAHFIAYFGLGTLITLSIVDIKKLKLKTFFNAWLLGSLYGVFDEIHQYFIPGRAAMLYDVVLDSLSVLAGVALTATLILISKKIDFKWLKYLT